MKFAAISALALLISASPVFAADATDPVKDIMDVATSMWSDNPPEDLDYFDKTHLERDFSKAFVAAYEEASKFPAFEEGTTPFDYDVITDSQDGCPLEDLAIRSNGEKDGVTDVVASFKLWTCAEDPSYKDDVTEVHFDVIVEDGKTVINDIHRKRDGQSDSLLAEMGDIAKPQQ